MAKVQIANQALQWGHTPMGEFFIQVALPIPQEGGPPLFAPLQVFVLTKDEEQALKAELLTGLKIAKSILDIGP